MILLTIDRNTVATKKEEIVPKFICTCCNRELDNEGVAEMRANEGYSGCCNDTVRMA